jgi:hypothetical protein
MWFKKIVQESKCSEQQKHNGWCANNSPQARQPIPEPGTDLFGSSSGMERKHVQHEVVNIGFNKESFRKMRFPQQWAICMGVGDVLEPSTMLLAITTSNARLNKSTESLGVIYFLVGIWQHLYP